MTRKRRKEAMGIDSSGAARRPQDGTSKYPQRRSATSYQERAACPLYTAIAVIGGRWKPMILQRLGRGPHGFGELQRAMPRVTAKVLREQLRQMQADGLVTREQLVPARLGVRFHVTAYGRTLNPVFTTLMRWGLQHLSRPGAHHGTMVRPPEARDDARL
jgi:DNA-binding HxlR family transcriptional regulator